MLQKIYMNNIILLQFSWKKKSSKQHNCFQHW